MKRTYLALASLALVAGLSPAPSLIPRVWAESLFSSGSVDANRFAVLARPVGGDDWTLVVLEQLRPRPLCWTPQADGLVDPTLNRFDFTGICGRFIDSNGYSLRVADTDLSHAFRLRIDQQGRQLLLLASSPGQPTELIVGRGTVPRRDRDLFVALQLEPGWELRRRVFGDRSLNHMYFSNAQPLDALIAAARGRTIEPMASRLGFPAPPPSLPPVRESQRVNVSTDGTSQRLRPERQRYRSSEAANSSPSEEMSPGVVQLQVIPYDDRISSEGGVPSAGRPAPLRESYDQAQGL